MKIVETHNSKMLHPLAKVKRIYETTLLMTDKNTHFFAFSSIFLDECPILILHFFIISIFNHYLCKRYYKPKINQENESTF